MSGPWTGPATEQASEVSCEVSPLLHSCTPPYAFLPCRLNALIPAADIKPPMSFTSVSLDHQLLVLLLFALCVCLLHAGVRSGDAWRWGHGGDDGEVQFLAALTAASSRSLSFQPV